MAQNDFLEGVRKGMIAYQMTRRSMQEYQGNQLQQETMRMQQEEIKRQKQDYMSPQEKAEFDLKQHEQKLNMGYDLEDRALQAKIARSQMTVNELNKKHPGMFYVDANGEVQQIKENTTRGRGKGDGETGMDFKNLKSAQEAVNDILIRNGVDTSKPENAGLYDRLMNKIMSGPDGYQKATGYLKLYNVMASGKYPELEDAGLSTPMDIVGEGGKQIQVDPQEYLEYVAGLPNSTERDIEQAIQVVISRYGSRGMLQNPPKQYIQGPPGPIEPFDVNKAVGKAIKNVGKYSAQSRMYRR